MKVAGVMGATLSLSDPEPLRHLHFCLSVVEMERVGEPRASAAVAPGREKNK